MAAQYTLYIITSVFTAGISLVLAGIAFRHRDRVGAGALAWLMLGAAGWTLVSGLGLLVKSEAAAYLTTRLAYFFFAALPVFWIHFAYQYVKRQLPPTPRLFFLLWIIPLVTVSLAWTNQRHHWFWRDLDFFWVDGLVTWKAVFGPGFWLHSLYGYSLMITGAVIIIRYAITSFRVYRMQTIVLLAGCLAPILASLPAVLGQSTLPLTPFGLTVTGLTYTWAVFHTALLDLRPIARDLLIEQVQDGMIVVDERQFVVDINPPALKLLGGDDRKILGSPADQVLQILTGRPLHIHELAHSRTEFTLAQQGASDSFVMNVSPLQDPHRQIIGHLIHLHDITHRKKIEEALRASESRSRAILAALPDCVHLIDQNGRCLDAQGTAHCCPPDLFSVYPQPLAQSMLDTVRATLRTNSSQSLTYQASGEDGAERWFEARTAPLVGENGGPPRVVWIDREITEQMQLLQKVAHLANTDALTGLVNRRRFFDLAQDFVDRQAPAQAPCAFILIDIDHFKEVNDQFGHLIGDQVLHLVASRLAQQVRAEDIVARYGGEEFILFLPNTPAQEAEQVARRLCRTIAAEPFVLDAVGVPLSISVGLVSTLIDGEFEIDRVIEKADDALYAAKRGGRNTVKVYAGEL